MNTRKLLIHLVLLFIAGNLSAEPLQINKEELLSRLKSQKEKIQAYQVKYELQYCKFTDEEDCIVYKTFECEYAQDRNDNKYLYEKSKVSGEQVLERKHAFDGKIGTSLTMQQPGDPGRMYGNIAKKVPVELSDQYIWKPYWGGYGYFQEYGQDSLYDAIRNGKHIIISSEMGNDGEHLLKVSFVLIGEKDSFIDPKTKREIEFTRDGAFVAWLSPEKEYAPVKVVMLRGEGGDVIGVREASDFRKVEAKIWIPHRIEIRSSGNKIQRILINSVLLNDNVKFVSKLTFPLGTYMENEITGLEYRVEEKSEE